MEPTQTSTKTKSISNTKLLVATVALIAAGGLAFGLTPSVSTPALLCHDSDGGKNPSIAGTVVLADPATSGTVDAMTDVCVTNTDVKEFFCDGGSIVSKIYPCKSGSICMDGACALTTPMLSPSSTLPTPSST